MRKARRTGRGGCCWLPSVGLLPLAACAIEIPFVLSLPLVLQDLKVLEDRIEGLKISEQRAISALADAKARIKCLEQEIPKLVETHKNSISKLEDNQKNVCTRFILAMFNDFFFFTNDQLQVIGKAEKEFADYRAKSEAEINSLECDKAAALSKAMKRILAHTFKFISAEQQVCCRTIS